MGIIRGKVLALVMASVWVLCLLHCVADQASAHLHQLPSGKVHHHHSTTGHSSDHHSTQGADQTGSDEDGEPLSEHAHDEELEVSECCALKARVSSPGLADRASDLELSSLKTSLASISARTPVAHGNSGSCIEENLGRDRFAEVAVRIRSLRAPNAPPSTHVC
jgi:hypothetical protein